MRFNWVNCKLYYVMTKWLVHKRSMRKYECDVRIWSKPAADAFTINWFLYNFIYSQHIIHLSFNLLYIGYRRFHVSTKCCLRCWYRKPLYHSHLFLIGSPIATKKNIAYTFEFMNGFGEELLLSLFSCIFLPSTAHDASFMFAKVLRKTVTKKYNFASLLSPLPST